MRLYELANNQPKSDTAVFTFGRVNPPTVGHEKLIQTVLDTAKKHGADHFVFLSHTHKPPKDPLPWNDKVELFKKAFPKANVWEGEDIRTPFQALGELGEDYDHILMVVGSDRVDEFRDRMSQYTDEWGIESFDVISAGGRDPDAAGVSGMSASKAREFAKEGDFKSFSQALPKTLSQAEKKRVYNKIRQATTK